MNYSFLKCAGIAVVVAFFSFSAVADNNHNEKSGNDFQSICTQAWMEKANMAKDKVDYKNFGEKYCKCAANQPLISDEEVQKAIQLCISRTLLHDAMDSLEDEVGFNKAKDTEITEYCHDRWNLIYPDLSDENKKKTMAYCDCAKPKLMNLMKQSDNMTDKQYEDGINEIADSCSAETLVEKTDSATTPPTPAPAAPATVPATTSDAPVNPH